MNYYVHYITTTGDARVFRFTGQYRMSRSQLHKETVRAIRRRMRDANSLMNENGGFDRLAYVRYNDTVQLFSIDKEYMENADTY